MDITAKKPLKILTFNWHTVYMYLMAKTGHHLEVADWIIMADGKIGWNYNFRPVPNNVYLIKEADEAINKIKNNYYDLAVCHAINDIDFLGKYNIPVIFVAHSPIKSMPSNADENIVRIKTRDFLNKRESLFVAISQAKLDNWDLPGKIILPGIDTSEYFGYTGETSTILTVGNFFKKRDHMLGYTLQKNIVNKMSYQIIGYNPDLPESRESQGFEDLKQCYRTNRVYLNTTLFPYEDGYNLAMLEAMATGMPVVSWISPSSPIINRVNGVLSDDLNYMRKKLQRLLIDINMAKEIGERGRQTVAEKFPLSGFIQNWNNAFESCLSGN